MKVLHLVGTLNAGGIERVVSQLVLYQKKVQHIDPIVACCVRREGQFLAQILEENIKVYDCSYSTSTTWKLTEKVVNLINQEHPHVIHSHVNFSLFWQGLSKLITSAPFIFTQHSISKYSETLPYRTRAFIGYKLISSGRFIHTAVSESAADYAARLFPCDKNDVRIIHNGIVPDNFLFDSSKKEFYRKEWGIRPNQIVIGCVGRLDYVKGYDILLRAFSRIILQNPALHPRLVIVGSGSLRNELEDLSRQLGVDNYVTWLGNTSDVAGVLSGFDIYAQASRWETLSLSILEAVANGLQVITTNTGGAVEISKKCENIHLCPIDSPESLAQLILDKVGLTPRNISSLLEFPAEFKLSTMAELYLRAYESLSVE